MSKSKELMQKIYGVKDTGRVQCRNCQYAFLPRAYRGYEKEWANNKCKYRPHRWLDSKMIRSCKEFLPCNIQKESSS